MTMTTTTQQKVEEQDSDLTNRIKRIEIAHTDVDCAAADDIKTKRKDDVWDHPRVRIVFESGGMLQIRQTDDMDIPVEESFKPNNPHSVYESMPLNGFIYEDEWGPAMRVQMAAEWNLNEMKNRSHVSSVEKDWENLSHCFNEVRE